MNRARCVGALGITAFSLGALAPTGLVAQETGGGTSRVASVDVSKTLSDVLSRHVNLDIHDASLRQALDAIAAAGGVQLSYTSRLIAPYTTRMSVQLHDVALGVALDRVLAGTALRVAAMPGGRLAVVSAADRDSVAATGTVMGRVIDAGTRQPIASAAVSLDGASRGVTTDNEGRFTLNGVAATSHTLTVRRVGYRRVAKPVVVQDGATTRIDVALEAAANTLDQVIVTGTVIPTELKAVPSAMTVITGQELERRGITHIDQLFRGDVPGVFSVNQGTSNPVGGVVMYSRGVTGTMNGSMVGASGITQNTNPIKTYVDGIELADPTYLSQIDPRSIERIEILTGPQASTIYGSNAMNGVMQIFTKRGSTTTPQLTVSLMSGLIQNNFSSALAPQHDASAQVDGIEGRISYNAGGNWGYVAPWSPSIQTERLGAFGGVRLSLPTGVGPVTADVNLRHTRTANTAHGAPEQLWTDYETSGLLITPYGSPGLGLNMKTISTQQTFGLTMSYAPTGWWSHELSAGQDVSTPVEYYDERAYRVPNDSLLYYNKNQLARTSLRYATTAKVPLSSLAQATATLGVDGWQSYAEGTSSIANQLSGYFAGGYVSRISGHNTGGFFQGQLAVVDRVFFTYGLRAEWNPNFGANAQPNYAPRYGVAYANDFGAVTAKLRASYGRATRPPDPYLKLAVKAADVFDAGVIQDYGNFDWTIANPNLGPEYQQGGEGGLELYFGTRGSLVVTRYNQTVDNVIANTKVDSARSLVPNPQSGGRGPDAQGYRYRTQYEQLNVASLRNQGWELQGSINTGPITTKGTYSWTKSTVIGVPPRYQKFFSGIEGFRKGDRFQFLPEHTWALDFSYTKARATVSLDVNGTGQSLINMNQLSQAHLNPYQTRLMNDLWNVNSYYLTVANGYTLADLNGTYRLFGTTDAVLQVQNLTNNYRNDYSAIYATAGRQFKAGVRMRLK